MSPAQANQLGIAIIAALGAGSVAAWGLLLVRWRRGTLPREKVLATPEAWDVWDVLVAVFLMFALAAASIRLLASYWELPESAFLKDLEPTRRVIAVWTLAGAQIAAFLVSFCWTKWRHNLSARRLGFDRDPLLADLQLGGFAFLLIGPPVFGIHALISQWFKSEHPLIETALKTPDASFLTAAAVSAVLVAPLVEEYLFRVLLQGWLETLRLEEPKEAEDEGPPPPPRVRPYWPILVSAGGFAAIHANHGPDPIPLFFFAVGLGVLYRRTQRITASLVVHLLLNLVTMIFLLLHILSAPGLSAAGLFAAGQALPTSGS